MRSRILLAGLPLLMTIVAAGTALGAEKPIRIGVYDSRAVAVAFGRSPECAQSFQKIRADFDKARADKDEARMKELENAGSWAQIRLHQQGFSTAGVANILAKVKDQLPAVAREAGVVAIVSKWETPYLDPSIEIVDITLPVARLFHPDEQTLEILEEMKSQDPIPFDELPLDPNL